MSQLKQIEALLKVWTGRQQSHFQKFGYKEPYLETKIAGLELERRMHLPKISKDGKNITEFRYASETGQIGADRGYSGQLRPPQSDVEFVQPSLGKASDQSRSETLHGWPQETRPASESILEAASDAGEAIARMMKVKALGVRYHDEEVEAMREKLPDCSGIEQPKPASTTPVEKKMLKALDRYAPAGWVQHGEQPVSVYSGIPIDKKTGEIDHSPSLDATQRYEEKHGIPYPGSKWIVFCTPLENKLKKNFGSECILHCALRIKHKATISKSKDVNGLARIIAGVDETWPSPDSGRYPVLDCSCSKCRTVPYAERYAAILADPRTTGVRPNKKKRATKA